MKTLFLTLITLCCIIQIPESKPHWTPVTIHEWELLHSSDEAFAHPPITLMDTEGVLTQYDKQGVPIMRTFFPRHRKLFDESKDPWLCARLEQGQSVDILPSYFE